MGTLFYYPSIFSTSSPMLNETSIENNDHIHLLHLFIFISVWFVLIITIVFGSTGNLLVLYVYINRNDNKTCTFFIKMLAIVDLIICLILAPLDLYQTTTGIRHEFICKLYGFLNAHVLYSTFLITVIAFDRYFCICWPLYKIITIRRAHIIVLLCGFLCSLFAIIPMSEYSTVEHVLQLHSNHSDKLSFETSHTDQSIVYTHVEHINTNVDRLPFAVVNITDVKCSPRFSLNLHMSKFLILYRIFHSTLFAICIILVLILYLFIYNAIYQRRRTRTKKISTYQRIFQSYLIKTGQNRQRIHRHSILVYLCCYCCQKFHQSFDDDDDDRNEHKLKYSLHEKSLMIKKKPEQIILEINGARGKRYSAISMTSMTYFTSGIWDETSPTNLIRSRVNSIAATTYCGTEQSSSSTTESSLHTSTHLRSSNSPFLTVPGQVVSSSICSNEINIKENHSNDNESLGNISPSLNLLHPTMARKSSNTLSIRQQPRSSDVLINPRKVSFLNSSEPEEHCIVEDPLSIQLNRTSSPSHHQLTTHLNNHHSLSPDVGRNSIISTCRGSTFDVENNQIFERQQKQERAANIRTTLTLFIVTATFILMYLPSIIITLFNIKPNEFREVLFLLYYINSACNPLIYSFFNANFRNDIRRIYECQKRVYLARQC
ncbi:hypothetical protein I4U23_000474 [Adineta vaga]|nr:hypothetical protein I4U23_000474 [Adineta vaga]